MHDSQAPTFRTARPEEIATASALCPPAPELVGEEPSHCFVAVDGPTEEIVGAIFWRKIPAENGTPDGVTFEWAMIPDLTDTPVETDFLIALVTEIQLAEPEARWLSPSTSLPEGHPLAERLIQAAFQQEATQTHHEANMIDVINWLEKFPGSPTPLPATAPLASHLHPLKQVLCGDDRPLRKSRLAHGFQAAARNQPTLFDSRCSVLFLDGEAIIAACLAAVNNGHLHLAALHLPTAPVQLLPDVLRQVITRAQLFAPPITLGFTLHPADPPVGLPALLEIPAFQRVGTSRSFRRELHFPG
jgi:hypothetical protein